MASNTKPSEMYFHVRQFQCLGISQKPILFPHLPVVLAMVSNGYIVASNYFPLQEGQKQHNSMHKATATYEVSWYPLILPIMTTSAMQTCPISSTSGCGSPSKKLTPNCSVPCWCPRRKNWWQRPTALRAVPKKQGTSLRMVCCTPASKSISMPARMCR